MRSNEEARLELLKLLQTKSVFHGDFTLASGAKSNYYIDCRLTTFDGKGAWLVGQVMHQLIQEEAARRGVQINSVGGLTMGADPIALAVGICSHVRNDSPMMRTFAVRKAAKAHGQTKLIEGNFEKTDTVVVIDDVVTSGESTVTAMNAVLKEGAKIAFIAVLVDRQQGGRDRIEQMGYPVVAAFTRDDLLGNAGAKAS